MPPVVVHPFEMDGIDRVLLALKPVARNFREDDLHEAVLPGERLPRWHERRWLRTEVGPHQSRLRLDAVPFQADGLPDFCVGIDALLVRLLDAAPTLVVAPAVIVASQAAVLEYPEERSARRCAHLRSSNPSVPARSR